MQSHRLAGKGLNGLFNSSNTCYVNTSIQCIGHCTSFLEFVLDGKYEKHIGDLINELREVLHALWVANNGIIPNRFLKYLQQHMPCIDIRQQNDIQEFITLFFDKMNVSLAVKLNVDSVMSMNSYDDSPLGKLHQKIDRSWYSTVGSEYSPIVEYFYGQSIVQILCGHCGKIHHNYEPFSLFMLPIIQQEHAGRGASMENCLHHHVSEEYLNDESDASSTEWNCDACKERAKSLQTIKFWRLPKVLTVCLKRFTPDLRKNNILVDIPQSIDLSEYTVGPTNKKYVLRSIACHTGVYGGGHYYAICKNPNGEWYKYDDTEVTKLEGSFKSPNTAYMIFYEAEIE